MFARAVASDGRSRALAWNPTAAASRIAMTMSTTSSSISVKPSSVSTLPPIGGRHPSLVTSVRVQLPLRLVVDPDTVRDARDVVEVADHLDRVRDVSVRESLRTQGVDVCLVGLGGERGQLHREVAERTLARRE